MSIFGPAAQRQAAASQVYNGLKSFGKGISSSFSKATENISTKISLAKDLNTGKNIGRAEDVFHHVMCGEIGPKIRAALGGTLGYLTPDQEVIFKKYMDYIKKVGHCGEYNTVTKLPYELHKSIVCELAKIRGQNNPDCFPAQNISSNLNTGINLKTKYE